MKLSKQQQILGGVMILGLVAVGVDRLMPKAGAADVEAADSAALLVEHKPAAATVATPTASRTHSFNQRLALAAKDANPGRDAFTVAAVWQSSAQPAIADVADTAADNFPAAHRLISTLTRGERSGAVIDGKLIVVGQTIDGFKLLSVTGRSATLSNGHSRVLLNQIGR